MRVPDLADHLRLGPGFAGWLILFWLDLGLLYPARSVGKQRNCQLMWRRTPLSVHLASEVLPKIKVFSYGVQRNVRPLYPQIARQYTIRSR